MSQKTVFLSRIDLSNRSVESRINFPFTISVPFFPTETINFVTNLGTFVNTANYSRTLVDPEIIRTDDFIRQAEIIAGHHTTYKVSTVPGEPFYGDMFASYIGPLYIIRWTFVENDDPENKFFYMIGTEDPLIPPSSDPASDFEFGSIISFFGGVDPDWNSYPLIPLGLKMTFNSTNLVTHNLNRDNVFMAGRSPP